MSHHKETESGSAATLAPDQPISRTVNALQIPPVSPNQALWEKGDFTRIAATMRDSGEALVRSLGVRPGIRVLDLGCGDGTTAVPLAQAGADVLGVDIARNLVAAGNRRSVALGLNRLAFREGDACNLGEIATHTFDLTVSIFGAMFAPRPFDVARELVRVTKPGGHIVMGNWIPNDPTSFVSQVLKVSAAFTPPTPEGFISPMTWGVESHIRERFGQAGVPADRIELEKSTFTFKLRGTPGDFIALFRHYYGPTMNAYEAAHKTGQAEELHRQLIALAESQGHITDSGLDVTASYLRVTVRP